MQTTEQILVNPKTELKQLFAELKATEEGRMEVCADKSAEIEGIQFEVDELSKPFLEKEVEIKKKILEIAAHLEESYKTKDGVVKLKKPFTRVTYDSEALDEFIKTLPSEVALSIMQFRKETNVTTKPQIEVY